MTHWIGAALIAATLGLLAWDVLQRDGVVIGREAVVIAPPRGTVGSVARWAAVNVTPICWVGYLLVMDGLLHGSRIRVKGEGSPIRNRPERFLAAWITSVPVWCYFDWVNFEFLDAWRYHNMPPEAWRRFMGYFVAFAAISPGMFLTAELLQRLGLRRWNAVRGVRISLAMQAGVLALGVAFTIYPFLVREPIGSLTLWVSLLFLLDPINHWLGAPSVLGDWRSGRFGRTFSLMAAGAICGLIWELWNYWAITKWTYRLPFTGSLEQYRYFEMPWIGFLGFLPFALECWVALNFILALLDAFRLRIAPPLPNDWTIL